MSEPDTVPEAARGAILAWYDHHGRKLPFRATTDPYAILVSEAMAQQTQAARAGEAWVRFMTEFPTPGALAAALPSDVLRAWRGLGYNRRALNLWRAARRIVEVHGGTVPADLHELEALPGVGPYTARAVAAIAFGMPVGAVDTNVRRVLGRILAGDAADLAGAAALQASADASVPTSRAGDWTHALMDIGATVCAPRTPNCASCPARPWCGHAASRDRSVVPPIALEGAAAGRIRRVREAAAPFPTTSRWLRGQIVDRLREVMGDGWIVIDAPIGLHDRAAVAAALTALVRDGLIELDPRDSASAQRARLAVG